MPLKQVLVIDKDRKMVYANLLKTEAVLCREHQSYVWFRGDEKSSFYCKKGKHNINYNSQEFELIEL